MKSAAEVLEQLGSLAEADRAWILAQLSPGAKARLLEEPQPSATAPFVAPSAVPVDADQISPRMLLARVDAERAAHAFATEPAWVLAALLAAEEWPWRAALIARLADPVRMELERLERTTFTVHLLDIVLRVAVQKVSGCEPPRRDSRFSKLVTKFSASRTRRRLSLHL